MQDAIRLLAGDCTVTYEDDDGVHTQRGRVVTLVKPDGTVLVHDVGGYRPAAWLTRADTVAVNRDGDAFRVVAASGATRLRVESHETVGRLRVPASVAGPPVGDCPDCGGTLVRDGDAVACTDCRSRYVVPGDAVLREARCVDCGLPTMRVERGATVDVCVDRACDPLAAAVADRFEGAWACPDCERDLTVSRERGLVAACPGCERRHRVPAGTVEGTCACGLPLFDVDGETRCLDTECRAGATP